MAHAYKHSESFAKMKGLDESIKTNLTSYQYLSVLDDLLYKAIYPIIEGTRFVDVFLAQMLGWQTINPKRKTSGLGRHAFGANTTLFLLSDSPKQKLKILKRMRLDRSMLFEILRRWFSVADKLVELGTRTASKLNMIEFYNLQEQCSVKTGFGLTSTYRIAHYWCTQALDFKKQILEKYTRLCLMTAKRDYEELEHRVQLNDIIQVYIMTALKAIDKCDSEKGVLTSHIQNWLLSAKNVVVNTYLVGAGVDHRQVQISTTTNKRIVDDLIESSNSEDMEELSHSDDDRRDKESELLEIRQVARVFDPKGYGRLVLHIQEQLDPSDSLALRALAVKDDRSDTVQTPPVNTVS